MRIWQIYKLMCPVTIMARYIGITTQTLEQRLKYHLAGNDYNPGKAQWIAGLQLQGLLPAIISIDRIKGTRAQAERIERDWVYEYIKAGHDLLNIKHIPEPRELFFEFLRSQAVDLSAILQYHQQLAEEACMLQQCSVKTGD